jgi:hypothetical protein
MYFKDQYPPEKLEKIITEAEEKGHIMTAGLFKDHEGLTAGHPYTVRGINKVKVDDDEVTLVRLRNPWAKEKYAGPYSRDDAAWTDDMKGQVDFDARVAKHIFWMTIDDFAGAFAQIAVAHTEDTWMASRAQIPLTKPKHSLKFNNPVE